MATKPTAADNPFGDATDAAVEAYLAWTNMRDASTPMQYATAMTELSNAMSDFSSWLPGYDVGTGTIAAERE